MAAFISTDNLHTVKPPVTAIDIEGIHDMGSPVVEKNCAMAENGKFYRINLDKLDKKRFQIQNPLRTDNNINTARDGIYVYIIATNKTDEIKGKYHIYSLRTLSIHEVKSKHTHLLNSVKLKKGIKNLYYAGEFKKKGKKVEFNFASGTYMVGHVDNILTEDDIERNIPHIEFVKRLFAEYGLTAKITINSLINSTNLALTMSQLNELVEYGVEVIEYDTKKECMDYINYPFQVLKAEMTHKNQLTVFNKYGNREKQLPPQLILPPEPKEGKKINQQSPTPAGLSSKRKRSTSSSARSTTRRKRQKLNNSI
jgi:hypothetical protein